MNYFKKVEYMLKKYHVTEKTSEELKTDYKQREKLLLEIRDFIKSGVWVRTRTGYDRIMYTLREGAPAAAEKYQCSLNCIYAGLSKASKRLGSIISANVFDLIENGDVETAKYLFYRNTGKIENLLIDYILKNLPKSKASDFGDITLTDCTEELKKMKLYTPKYINSMLSKCDSAHLEYINMLLITKDTQYLKQQQELYKYLLK